VKNSPRNGNARHVCPAGPIVIRSCDKIAHKDDRALEAAVHVNTDPPYNVKVEPHSNNAIAVGLSSLPSRPL